MASSAISDSSSGIKIALDGYDARTAPDYNLAFSSNWPSIQVAKTFIYEITASDISYDPDYKQYYLTTGNGLKVFTHNFSKYCYAAAWILGTDGTCYEGDLTGVHMGKNSVAIDMRALFDQAQTPRISTNENDLLGIKIQIKVYNFDFTQNFSYPYSSQPTIQGFYSGNTGIKIVRQGRDIHSKDLRDFTLHSKGAAPQILSVTSQVASTGLVYGAGDPSSTNGGTEGITFKNTLGATFRYSALYQGGFNPQTEASTGELYYTAAGHYYYSTSTYGVGEVPGLYYSDNSTYYFITGARYTINETGELVSTGTMTGGTHEFDVKNPKLVIFRQPMLAAQNVEVSY